MARVTLSVPADLMKAARTKLGGVGQARVKEYLISSLQSLAHDQESLSPETIRKLMEGLRSPAIRATEAYWRKKIHRYKMRNRPRKSKRAA